LLVQADTHERLKLPTAASKAPCVDWEQNPDLEPAYNRVSKRIAPLQERTRPAWLYTEVNDVTRLERGDRSALSDEALALVMGKLSPDPSSHDFITSTASCQPLCIDQAVRSMLLVAMPSMDDVGTAPIQRGDQSRGTTFGSQ
jgi:hypothetical protein